MQKDDFKEAVFWMGQRAVEKVCEVTEGQYGEVLMCHEVSDHIEQWYNEDYSVKSSSMIAFLTELRKAGYAFDSISNIERKDRKRIFLTFDDGFQSVYYELYPFLRNNKIPFCIFVTVNFINQPNYLTLEMLREISRSDCAVIGAHTMSHPILRKLGKKESLNEILTSKKVLEKMIHKEVKYFAYPYGCLSRCSLRNIRQAKQCGYTYAFSTIDAHVKLFGKYFIPRRNVSESSLADLRRKLIKEGDKNE